MQALLFAPAVCACVHAPCTYGLRSRRIHPHNQPHSHENRHPLVDEQVAQKLRKLKHLTLLPVYELVEKEIVGFYNSLPLMKELKSEALRCARQLCVHACMRACFILLTHCTAPPQPRLPHESNHAVHLMHLLGSGTGCSSWK